MIEVTNEHEESVLRRCREHGEYFITGIGPHAKHDSYALTWTEAIYYLNKLDKLQRLFSTLRQEL